MQSTDRSCDVNRQVSNKSSECAVHQSIEACYDAADCYWDPPKDGREDERLYLGGFVFSQAWLCLALCRISWTASWVTGPRGPPAARHFDEQIS